MTQVFQRSNGLQLVRFEMQLAEFPYFLRKGVGTDGRLAKTEHLAQRLIDCDFNPLESVKFVKAVCLWGSDPRRAGKVIKRNSQNQISDVLRVAHISTKSNRIGDALKAIISLDGLAVSFGSKHLKFLDPNKHVVLDSIISERFGYRRDAEGIDYLRWISACREFLEIVIAENVEYTGIGNNGWRIADIEMAIFNKIRSE